MLYWSVVFLCVAMTAAVLGYSGFAGPATTAALVIFWLFQGAFALTLILGLSARNDTA